MSDLVIHDIRVLVLDWRAEPMIDAWLLIEDGRVKASGVGKPPVAPSVPQEGPDSAQEPPKSGQERPKSAPRAPKSVQVLPEPSPRLR